MTLLQVHQCFIGGGDPGDTRHLGNAAAVVFTQYVLRETAVRTDGECVVQGADQHDFPVAERHQVVQRVDDGVLVVQKVLQQLFRIGASAALRLVAGCLVAGIDDFRGRRV